MSRNVIVGGCLACFSLLLAAGSPSAVEAQDTVLTELYGRGVHAFHRGDYGQAYRLLETAVAEGTTDPRVHYFLGLTSYRMGDTEAAEKSFAVGAKLELNRGTSYPVGKALERIQGSERLLLEDYRDRVRTEQYLDQKARDQARYEARQAAEEDILRDRTRAAPAEPPVPVPPSDETDPFGVEGGPPPVAPEPAAPVRPSLEEPEEAMAEPALPADPAADADPFGAPVDDDSTPPVDDPFGTETAPSMQNPPTEDPFGAAPVPAGEQPLPEEPADTFGDAPPASPPGNVSPAFGVNPDNAVDNPDRESTRGTVPIPTEVPEPVERQSLGEVAPFPATNEPNPYSGPAEDEDAPAPTADPAMEADVPAADDPFGAVPVPADDTPAPADDPFGNVPQPADMPADEPAADVDAPAADDPFGAMPAPADDTPAPTDDPFGNTPEPADVPADEPAADDVPPAADDPFGAMPAPADDTPAPTDDPFGNPPEPTAPADDPFGASAPEAEDAATNRRSNPVGAAFGALSRALIPDINLPSLPGTSGGGNMPMGAEPGAMPPQGADDPFGADPSGADPFGSGADTPFGAPSADMPAENGASEAPAANDPFGPSAQPQDDPFGSPPQDDPFGATDAPADDPFGN